MSDLVPGAMMGKVSKACNIGERKTCTVNQFKGKTYLHFLDKVKGRQITFSTEEFGLLLKKTEDIRALVREIKGKVEKPKPKEDDFPDFDTEENDDEFSGGSSF